MHLRKLSRRAEWRRRKTVAYMPRTVSSPDPKSHGFCDQRGFREVQLNTWADAQSGRKPRQAEESHSVMGRCVSALYAQQAVPQRLPGVDLLGCSNQPTLIFVSYSKAHFGGLLTTGLAKHPRDVEDV